MWIATGEGLVLFPNIESAEYIVYQRERRFKEPLHPFYYRRRYGKYLVWYECWYWFVNF